MRMRDACVRSSLLPSLAVPPYSTAYEGVHALVLSPDETQVLLCWEGGARGKWASPGGHFNESESLVEAVIREINEEVGVEIDLSAGVKLLGGHQTARSRDNHVNSVHKLVALRAASLEMTIDQVNVMLLHPSHIIPRPTVPRPTSSHA